MNSDPMLMLEMAAAKREEQDAAWRFRERERRLSPFALQWIGRTIAELEATAQDTTGAFWDLSGTVLDRRTGIITARPEAWHAEYHGGRFEDCPAPTCSGEVPA